MTSADSRTPEKSPRRPIVLIFGNHFGVCIQAVQCLVAGGTFDVHVLSTERDSLLKWSRWVKKFHFIEPSSDRLRLLEDLKAVLRSDTIDVLLPINVDMIDFLITHGDDELRSLVRMPDQPFKASFDTACSKAFFSEFMEEQEIPHPKSVVFFASDLAFALSESVLQALRMPVIIKPAWGGGGAGFRIFTEHQGLLPYLAETSTPGNPLVVQELIKGYDVGSAVYCRKGKILYQTIQRKIYPWTKDSFTPSKGMSFFDSPEMRNLVEHVMMSLEWNGIAQIDLFVNEETGAITTLEINPRYWGSLLASQRMGINFPEIACRRALDRPIPPQTYRMGKYITAAGYFLYLKDRLLGVKGPDTFCWRDSPIDEIIKDPLPRIMQFSRRIILPRLQKLWRKLP